MAPGTGVVDLFDLRLQVAGLAAAHRVDEVRGVAAAAVATEFGDFLAIQVVGLSAAASSGIITVFTFDDEEGVATAAAVKVIGLHILAARQIMDIHDNRHFAGVEINKVRVGGFTRIPETDAPATGHDAFRQRDFVAEDHIAQVVENVRAPVAEFPVSGVPVPVPVVVEFLPQDRNVLRRAQPEVVVAGGGRREGRRPFADGLTDAVVVAAHPLDFPQLAAVEEGLDLILHRTTALLGAPLDDAVIFPGGLHQLPAFPDVLGDGFFNVNILPGLTGPQRSQHVPVVAGRNHHGINVFRLNNFAQVLHGGGPRVFPLGGIQRVGVRIAQHGNLDARHRRHAPGIALPLPAEADGSDADLFIGAHHPGGGERGGGQGGVAEEGAAAGKHGRSGKGGSGAASIVSGQGFTRFF